MTDSQAVLATAIQKEDRFILDEVVWHCERFLAVSVIQREACIIAACELLQFDSGHQISSADFLVDRTSSFVYIFAGTPDLQ